MTLVSELSVALWCRLICSSAPRFAYKLPIRGRLPIPKKVNLKKDGKTKTASVTPPGSNELHSPKISHLHFF
uniref:Neuronal regeneration-related protein n=2 Tax=Bos TaxID=9903 RepID=A0A3Q1MWG2_BOVIN